MIQRFSQNLTRLFWPGCIAAGNRPGVNAPEFERKTKADVRREILGKLTTRMIDLGLFKMRPNN
jgi:hypothetical protein